jgi:hypothetical protein
MVRSIHFSPGAFSRTIVPEALDGLRAAKAELRHIEIRAIMPPFSGCVRLSVPKLSD